MEYKWWHKPLRIIQYNLQMKDTPLMDAEKIARETEEMGGNAVVINVADSVVWYKTAVHFQKINPYLPEDRDWLQEMIDAFHKRNIKVFARGAFMGFEEETYYQKPQWAKRKPDGSPVMLGNERPGEWFRLYSPCPNSGFVYESGYNIAAEAFKKYDLDGAFWLNGSVTSGKCYCDHCKQLYRETYGEEMPEDPAKLNPLWDLEINNRMQTQAMETVLQISGVEEEHREAFSQRFEEEFGADARLAPQNLVDKRKLEICTPDVTIQVSPDRGDLVETRIIDGAGYILIRAEGGVEVNGVPIRLVPEEEEERPF